MGKSTISMVIFNSYVKLPEGKSCDLTFEHSGLTRNDSSGICEIILYFKLDPHGIICGTGLCNQKRTSNLRAYLAYQWIYQSYTWFFCVYKGIIILLYLIISVSIAHLSSHYPIKYLGLKGLISGSCDDQQDHSEGSQGLKGPKMLFKNVKNIGVIVVPICLDSIFLDDPLLFFGFYIPNQQYWHIHLYILLWIVAKSMKSMKSCINKRMVESL